MKLVSLNLWGGKIFVPLMEYLRAQSVDTDVFCFQEMLCGREAAVIEGGYHTNLLAEVKDALPEFDVWFASMQDNWAYSAGVISDVSFGVALAVKRSLHATGYGEVLVYGTKNEMDPNNPNDTIARVLQYVTVPLRGAACTVYNLHGIATYPKTDTPGRLEQSNRIREFISARPAPLVLTGDFNLSPESESIRILDKGLRNLTREAGNPPTRSGLHTLNFDTSDYMIVSPDIAVKSFEIPDVEVSDHLPLVLVVS